MLNDLVKMVQLVTDCTLQEYLSLHDSFATLEPYTIAARKHRPVILIRYYALHLSDLPLIENESVRIVYAVCVALHDTMLKYGMNALRRTISYAMSLLPQRFDSDGLIIPHPKPKYRYAIGCIGPTGEYTFEQLHI